MGLGSVFKNRICKGGVRSGLGCVFLSRRVGVGPGLGLGFGFVFGLGRAWACTFKEDGYRSWLGCMPGLWASGLGLSSLNK